MATTRRCGRETRTVGVQQADTLPITGALVTVQVQSVLGDVLDVACKLHAPRDVHADATEILAAGRNLSGSRRAALKALVAGVDTCRVPRAEALEHGWPFDYAGRIAAAYPAHL